MKDLMAKINEGQNLGHNTYELKGLNKNQYNMLAAFVELVFNDKSKKEMKRIQNYMDMHDWDTDLEWKDIVNLYDMT